MAKSFIENKKLEQVNCALIKRDYVLYNRDAGYLADKYHLDEVEIAALLEMEGWTKEKTALEDKIKAELGEKPADPLEHYSKLYEKSVEILNKLLEADISQAYKHLFYYGDPYVRSDKTDEIITDHFGKAKLIKADLISKKIESKPIEDAKKLAKTRKSPEEAVKKPLKFE